MEFFLKICTFFLCVVLCASGAKYNAELHLHEDDDQGGVSLPWADFAQKRLESLLQEQEIIPHRQVEVCALNKAKSLDRLTHQMNRLLWLITVNAHNMAHGQRFANPCAYYEVERMTEGESPDLQALWGEYSSKTSKAKNSYVDRCFDLHARNFLENGFMPPNTHFKSVIEWVQKYEAVNPNFANLSQALQNLMGDIGGQNSEGFMQRLQTFRVALNSFKTNELVSFEGGKLHMFFAYVRVNIRRFYESFEYLHELYYRVSDGDDAERRVEVVAGEDTLERELRALNLCITDVLRAIPHWTQYANRIIASQSNQEDGDQHADNTLYCAMCRKHVSVSAVEEEDLPKVKPYCFDLGFDIDVVSAGRKPDVVSAGKQNWNDFRRETTCQNCEARLCCFDGCHGACGICQRNNDYIYDVLSKLKRWNVQTLESLDSGFTDQEAPYSSCSIFRLQCLKKMRHQLLQCWSFLEQSKAVPAEDFYYYRFADGQELYAETDVLKYFTCNQRYDSSILLAPRLYVMDVDPGVLVDTWRVLPMDGVLPYFHYYRPNEALPNGSRIRKEVPQDLLVRYAIVSDPDVMWMLIWHQFKKRGETDENPDDVDDLMQLDKQNRLLSFCCALPMHANFRWVQFPPIKVVHNEGDSDSSSSEDDEEVKVIISHPYLTTEDWSMLSRDGMQSGVVLKILNACWPKSFVCHCALNWGELLDSDQPRVVSLPLSDQYMHEFLEKSLYMGNSDHILSVGSPPQRQEEKVLTQQKKGEKVPARLDEDFGVALQLRALMQEGCRRRKTPATVATGEKIQILEQCTRLRAWECVIMPDKNQLAIAPPHPGFRLQYRPR